jgi:sulfofructose kinase
VLLFDGHEPEISEPLLEEATCWGSHTVLDAGSLHRGTERLWQGVGHLVCSEIFSRQLSGAATPEATLEVLARRHPLVVVTLGSRGLIWARDGARGRLPAFEVKARDTTGAGDVFHGAYAGCLALGMGWEETLRYASAAAALSCTKMGARPGIPQKAEVERFLSERS